jgi:flagellar protein FliO/FliZ
MGVLLEFLGLSALVIGLAYFSLRFLGQRVVARGHRNLRVREALSLGPNRLLALVEVAGKVYLIGVSPNHIDVLDEVDPERMLPEESFPQELGRMLPKDVLQNLEERVRRLYGR